MRQVLQKQMVFKKEHTPREVFQFIVDPDAPDLTLSVQWWHYPAKAAWITLNVIVTFASCFALIWLSYPEYVDSGSYSDFRRFGFLNVVEFMTVVFFTGDYVLRFVASDKPALDFVCFDIMNVLDVLTTGPYYLQLVVASAGGDPGGLFRFFFVIRMSRVIRLSRYHRGMTVILESLKTSAPMLILFLAIGLITLIITSSAIFFVERTRFDNTTQLWYSACPKMIHWYDANFTAIPRIGNCTERIAPMQSISDGMYWSVNKLTLTNFVTETSTLGKVVGAVTATLGIMLLVAPATILTANYKEQRKDIERKQVTRMLNERATSAMKSQEVLRKEMERLYRLHKQEERQKMIADDPLAPIPNGAGGAASTIAETLFNSRSPRPQTANSAADDGGFALDDFDGTSNSRSQASVIQARKLKALQAVLPQSELSGKIKLEENDSHKPVCVFSYRGQSRTIYEVKAGSVYLYEPLLYLKKRRRREDNAEEEEGAEDGSTATPPPPKTNNEQLEEVEFADDFNVRTAERILTCFIVMDTPEARIAAKNALVKARIIEAEDGDAEGEVLVKADRSGPVNVQHDYAHIYPELESIVYLDPLPNCQAANNDEVGVRFVVVMPHQHGIEDAMSLLKHTRLSISVGIRKKMFTLHFPLSMSCIMASRFIRELVTICYTRPTDGHQVAYIHQHDAMMLLEGFCDQFIPTPSPEVLIVAPHVVDQQVFLALKGSCPSLRLDYVPLDAANCCFRSSHLNPQALDQCLMEVDLTLLDALDDMGYGTRMKLHVQMCEEYRYDAYIPMH